MLNIRNHQGNENQNDSEILPHTYQNSCHQKDKRQVLARLWRQDKPDQNVNGYPYGKQYGGFSKN